MSQPKVQVARTFVGICHMQVCCERDATDEEILSVCNALNPAGTSNGWGSVIRENFESTFWPAEKMRPVPCDDYPGRVHVLVGC